MHILFGTDGSAGAQAAAHLLAALPLASEDQVTVMTAVSAEETEAALQSAREALAGTPAAVRYEGATGSPARELLARAEQEQPALIAVGSRGLNPVARLLLGSVAERVVYHAPCPVLVARPLQGKLDRVVLGFDGSAPARDAVDLIRRLPFPPGCEFRIVTALPRYQPLGTPAGRVPGLAAELTAIQAEEQRQAQQRLEEAAALLRADGRTVHAEFRQDYPARGLLEVAARDQADLLVVGRLGLTGIERFRMGSVSTAVLRHAPCSVLVVPAAGIREGSSPE